MARWFKRKKSKKDKPAPAPARARKEKQAHVPTGPAIPTLDDAQQAIADGLVAAHGLGSDDAAILAYDPWLRGFFEATVPAASAQSAANWVLHEIQHVRKESGEEAIVLDGSGLAELITLVEDGTVSSRTGKELLNEVALSGERPKALVEARGLAQIDDADAIAKIAAEVVAANAGKAAAYRDGKKGLIGFFMGQVMKATSGKANPGEARKALEAVLG